MSSTENDIEIDLEKLEQEDAAKAAADKKKASGEEEPPKQKEKAVVKPDEGLEKLKKQLADERAARAKAESDAQEADDRAREANEAASRSQSESHDNKLALINNAINATKSANEALKAKYKEARAANDLDAEFAIQEELSANSTKLQFLENGKTALESQAKEKPAKVTKISKNEMVEQFASRCTPTSAAWVRSHPDYITDETKNAAMIGAHNLARYKKIAVDTPEYFKFIEDQLGIVKNGDASGHEEVPLSTDGEIDPMADAATEVSGRSSAPQSAPVSRGGGSDESGSNPKTMRLTPEEVESAELSGMTKEEYAKQKAILIKEGKIARKH